MDGLLTQRCSDHGDRDGGGDVRGHIHRRRRSMSVKLAVFHVMGPMRGSLGASFVPADWQVRVVGSSRIVYRLYERLYLQTITMYGCMERSSVTYP